MDYRFDLIEPKWQDKWREDKVYSVEVDTSKPKYYVLDMFPYPSGAGLHVGHPLGYIASDIFSRYKRLKGFNVLHPMGYDAFGLPAEQYAIQTGQHPAKTTEENTARYREQLDRIGFSYDWEREVRTCDPDYYKWTQWVFLKMFDSYYDNSKNKAQHISKLISQFEANGSVGLDVAQTKELVFSAKEWGEMTEKEQQEVLHNYRLAFRADTMVNWCEALGTVLANDEVKDGLSERGGHPVVQRVMKQWSLRVTAYADRLLRGLDNLQWSDSLKEIQRNWIGYSEGASLFFALKDSDQQLEVFTTRADTLFGVTFMVIAPEHPALSMITTGEQAAEVEAYVTETKKRSERERMTDAKRVSGVFTGGYAIHPFSGQEIPVYISDYVLISYGTGAIMAVPAHDSRDWAFATHFNLPIIPVVEGGDVTQGSYDAKEGKMINSELLNGLEVKAAIKRMISEIESCGIGSKRVNYRLRDAIFSRQRYWGEPFPIYYKDDVACPLSEDKLPLTLPDLEDFTAATSGEPPLSLAKGWHTEEGYPYELSTMPGFAGSSAYYLRYMDSKNSEALVGKEANEYWQSVDLYVGGIEHATGHLIYSRFWNKFLYDFGYVCDSEPFKKLVNQGMIQGRSNYVYRQKGTNTFVSKGLIGDYDTQEIHVDVNIVKNDILDIEAFRKWRAEYADCEFIFEDGKYICGWGIEKMSKSMHNVVNPDYIIERYGADTLRMYEMFLGPLEQSKPWDTNGIDGVSKFIRKYWKLFFNSNNEFELSDAEPTAQELKILHKSIKKVESDIENFSFNTSVSAFMICVNELGSLKCNKRAILKPLTIILSPYIPHVTEELWSLMGEAGSICDAIFPAYCENYLVESEVEYPVSFNGKVRFKQAFAADAQPADIEEVIRASEQTEKYLNGASIKKVIVVKGRIINVVH